MSFVIKLADRFYMKDVWINIKFTDLLLFLIAILE